MQKRKLGSLEVSALGMGCMNLSFGTGFLTDKITPEATFDKTSDFRATLPYCIHEAMQKTSVRWIIGGNSIGIYDSPLKPVLKPYRKLADIIENSGLDYTIILRSDWFANADEVDYIITNKDEPEISVSRKSIAAFIATIIKNPKFHKNENLGISKPIL